MTHSRRCEADRRRLVPGPENTPASRKPELRQPSPFASLASGGNATMSIQRRLVAVATAAVVLCIAQPAHAVDLTGEWHGDQVCDRFNGGKFRTDFPDDIMLISQEGDTVYVSALFDGADFALHYQGNVIDAGKKPSRKGEASLVECTSAPGSEYAETVRATRLDAKKGAVAAQFVATSIYTQMVDEAADHGTCIWKYTRVSTADPGVGPCAAEASASAADAAVLRRP